MYNDFYGFTEKPYSKTPDPRFLYLSAGHREALARLQYVVEEREIALLTGDIGCGKTTISRALMDSMGDACHFCFIFNPRLTAIELLRVIARNLAVAAGCGHVDRPLQREWARGRHRRPLYPFSSPLA